MSITHAGTIALRAQTYANDLVGLRRPPVRRTRVGGGFNIPTNTAIARRPTTLDLNRGRERITEGVDGSVVQYSTIDNRNLSQKEQFLKQHADDFYNFHNTQGQFPTAGRAIRQEFKYIAEQSGGPFHLRLAGYPNVRLTNKNGSFKSLETIAREGGVGVVRALGFANFKRGG